MTPDRGNTFGSHFILRSVKTMQERLHKYMASCGIASRRKCEEIILEGRIKVNNKTVTEVGFKIDTLTDKVEYDGKQIIPEERKVYIALNKPEGFVCTVKDEKNRKTIMDLVNIKERIYPIGRLDFDSSGLLLMTNDGDIYNKIIHPSRQINKTYIAVINGILDASDITHFNQGIDIGGYITAPAQISVIKISEKNSSVKIIIHEGKNRQIRRMCEKLGHPVIQLKRISIGSIKLDGIEMGRWRYLTDEEIKYLKSL
jgi:23S rRNA pseudouridine2605 synthase